MQRVLYADPHEELTRLAYGRVLSVSERTAIVTLELQGLSSSSPPVVVTCRLPAGEGAAPRDGDLVEVLLAPGTDVPPAGANRQTRTLIGSMERPIALMALRRIEEREGDAEEFDAVLLRREGKGWIVSIDGIECYANGEPPRGGRQMEPAPGDRTKVQILRLARERGGFSAKFSTRLKQQIRNASFADVAVGQRIVGRVVSIVEYGAFIEVETPNGSFVALLHNSEVSWAPSPRAQDVLQRDSQREFQVIKVGEDDDGNPRAWLSLRALLPSPWDQYGDDVAEGEELMGVVSNVTDYGAFIEIFPGLDGLLHRSDLTPPCDAGEVVERLNAGDKVWCRVIKVDRTQQRISLAEIKPPEIQW